MSAQEALDAARMVVQEETERAFEAADELARLVAQGDGAGAGAAAASARYLRARESGRRMRRMLLVEGVC